MGRFYDQVVCGFVPERADHAGFVEYTGAGNLICADRHPHRYNRLHRHAIHETYQPCCPHGNHKYSNAECGNRYRYLLMLLFLSFGIKFGFGTILLAHITFNIPYVILSVMPRMKQLNPSTYEAASTWAHLIRMPFSKWYFRISCRVFCPVF